MIDECRITFFKNVFSFWVPIRLTLSLLVTYVFVPILNALTLYALWMIYSTTLKIINWFFFTIELERIPRVLEKLIVAQVVKKFPAFCGNWRSPNFSSLQVFRLNYCTHFSFPPANYMFYPSQPPWFCHPNTWWTVQIMKFFSM